MLETRPQRFRAGGSVELGWLSPARDSTCVAVPWDRRHKLSDDLIETGVGEIVSAALSQALISSGSWTVPVMGYPFAQFRIDRRVVE